ncbi:MAG: VWA domain-containing protein, partial [Planctomycetota bacterium]|nr:VWA domain-containing protein [Planctomycetota bacterium]
PLSTFSIDVDTAAYSIVRSFLNRGQLPPKDAVRLEEMINYFRYEYSPPADERPFSANVEVAQCPWNGEHRLVRVGLKGKEVSADERPPSNLVFLIDVSGSMSPQNKLPLLKAGMKMMVRNLTARDRVAIVVYAGSSGLVLPSTYCDSESSGQVLGSLERLKSGGSTNGGAGIQLAYDVATKNFIKGGINRVILATDGDFNVGVTNRGDLIRLIEEKAKSKVFLSVLGFGMGNYKDTNLEQLANKGNGNYAYIDDLSEAKKVLVDQIGGTLMTIAKDVKIQIEFNPFHAQAYRLIGYENRLLAKEDFNDDTKDAGEIGAGHTVTALYEVVPAGVKKEKLSNVDPLKYQKTANLKDEAKTEELLTLKLRYKEPEGEKSKLQEFPIKDSRKGYAAASEDFKFAASVAAFGMLIRDSKYRGNTSYDAVLELVGEATGKDRNGYRREFLHLVKEAKRISGK